MRNSLRIDNLDQGIVRGTWARRNGWYNRRLLTEQSVCTKFALAWAACTVKSGFKKYTIAARSVAPGIGMRQIRILVADDHEVVRMGIKALLQQRPNLRVVAEASTGEEAVQQALTHQPDVVVMDIR